MKSISDQVIDTVEMIHEWHGDIDGFGSWQKCNMPMGELMVWNQKREDGSCIFLWTACWVREHGDTDSDIDVEIERCRGFDTLEDAKRAALTWYVFGVK